MSRWKVAIISAIVVTAFSSTFTLAAENEIEQARELMKAGMPGEAYSLLEKQEFDKAGDADFDYLLGIAALDSGRPDKATLAF